MTEEITDPIVFCAFKRLIAKLVSHWPGALKNQVQHF